MHNKISIYTSLFWINKNGFDFWRKSLLNFSQFADEVVIGTCEEGINDGTFDIIDKWAIENKVENVKVVVDRKIKLSDITSDGALKNLALQSTSNEVKISLDCDEIIPLSQKQVWDSFIQLFMQSTYQAVFLPSIDLWGNESKIRADKEIGVKWRIHKGGLYRGVNPRAWLPGGKFDSSKSDSCELITENGNFPMSFRYPSDTIFYQSKHSKNLQQYPYVLHYGYADFDKKAHLGKVFWKEKWKSYDGKEPDVATSSQELDKFETIEHGLKLD